MNKKCFVNWSLICDAHSLGQDLEHFRKPASQLVKYANIYPITNFHIMVIPEAIFIRSQYWPSGIVIACVCVSVCLCLCLCVCESVCQWLACPHDNSGPVRARITKFVP